MTLAFAGSTVPAFRAALKAALEARPGLKGVAVTDGKPPANVLTREEFLAILDTVGTTAARPHERTTQPRDERYVQHIAISVVGQTREAQTALGDRVYAIADELFDQLRSTLRLEGYYAGPGVLYSVLAGGWSYMTRADDMHRESALELELDVHARI